MGWDDRPASEAELADMRAMLREGMEEGAYGLSTGYQKLTHTGSAKRSLRLVDDAVCQGQDVTMDCFHYAYSSTRLLILIPV